MTSLFFGETGGVCPHSAPCRPTHPQVALKSKRASVILQVPQGIARRVVPKSSLWRQRVVLEVIAINFPNAKVSQDGDVITTELNAEGGS
jgi:hypothetical protein